MYLKQDQLPSLSPTLKFKDSSGKDLDFLGAEKRFKTPEWAPKGQGDANWGLVNSSEPFTKQVWFVGLSLWGSHSGPSGAWVLKEDDRSGIVFPQNPYSGILTASTSECELHRRESLYRGMKLIEFIRMGPNPMQPVSP